ncbi:MAG: hypothetical protein HY051_04050 [Candidatus Aenigmarchaeota archaeon]|nr:hypothetical protein [Candidatus Aenigmarchaeota archaeon]
MVQESDYGLQRFIEEYGYRVAKKQFHYIRSRTSEGLTVLTLSNPSCEVDIEGTTISQNEKTHTEEAEIYVVMNGRNIRGTKIVQHGYSTDTTVAAVGEGIRKLYFIRRQTGGVYVIQGSQTDILPTEQDFKRLLNSDFTGGGCVEIDHSGYRASPTDGSSLVANEFRFTTDIPHVQFEVNELPFFYEPRSNYILSTVMSDNMRTERLPEVTGHFTDAVTVDYDGRHFTFVRKDTSGMSTFTEENARCKVTIRFPESVSPYDLRHLEQVLMSDDEWIDTINYGLPTRSGQRLPLMTYSRKSSGDTNKSGHDLDKN